jgi:UDP-3-O-[3-hydroxymyristoyl] glucosamine N-acyltransferase
LPDSKFSLEKIAQFLEGRLEGDPNAEVINVSAIESTALNTITFSTDTKTLKKAKNFLATAIVLHEGLD